jgi:hypothetical protein
MNNAISTTTRATLGVRLNRFSGHSRS